MNDNIEPKQRNSALTRARILAAAEDMFAEKGYSQAGIRDIARAAGVAPSLLLRYFGSKAELFENALLHAVYAESLFVRDKNKFGERMTRLLAAEGDDKITSMILMAAGDPDARTIASNFSKKHIIDGLANWLGGPNAEARAMSIMILFTGFVVNVYKVPSGPLRTETAKWFAKSLQSLVDGRSDA